MDLRDSLYTYKGSVVRVIDGDTVEVDISAGFHLTARHRVRLLGCDTPERGEFGWYTATQFTLSKLNDLEVFIRTIKDDAFGRYLADIWYESHTGELIHFNEELRQSGLLKENSKWNEV